MYYIYFHFNTFVSSILKGATNVGSKTGYHFCKIIQAKK